MANLWILLQNMQCEQNLLREKCDKLSEIVENLLNALMQSELQKIKKNKTQNCKFFQSGYCKKESNCEFVHTSENCKSFLETGVCGNGHNCSGRHPRKCRYWRKGYCWRGASCVFQHCEAEFNSDKNDVEEPIGEQVEDANLDKSEEEHSEPNESETDLDSIDEDYCTETAVNHDEEVEEMSVDDIIKFYEDETNLFKDKDIEKYSGIVHEEVVTKPNEKETTKAKNMKLQIIVPTKSSKKKKPKIKQTK